MKYKNFIRFILIGASILSIFLFISGCSGSDVSAKSETASVEIQIAESSVSQSSQQQQDNNGSYEKWKCIERGCDYIYDPAIGDATQGIAPGTKFEDLPADWLCPVCNKGKDHFVKL